MTTRTTGASARVYGRIAGILYLLIIAVGAFGQISVRGTLVVPSDPVSTAESIMASQPLWRIGVAGDIMMHVFDIPVMLVLYVLLKPVNRNLALLGLLFNLTQTAVLVANESSLVMPLILLGNADYLKALEPGQLYSLTYLFVRAHEYGFGIGLVFFGFTLLVQGYLLFRSGYFPRPLGVLMAIAGLSYLANSFSLILTPAYSVRIAPVLVLALIGELSLSLWLIVKGVNVPEWEKRVLEST